MVAIGNYCLIVCEIPAVSTRKIFRVLKIIFFCNNNRNKIPEMRFLFIRKELRSFPFTSWLLKEFNKIYISFAFIVPLVSCFLASFPDKTYRWIWSGSHYRWWDVYSFSIYDLILGAFIHSFIHSYFIFYILFIYLQIFVHLNLDFSFRYFILTN